MEFDDDEMRKWTSAAGFQFFLRVWFPCFMEYRVYPVELMARQHGTGMAMLWKTCCDSINR